MTTGNGAPRRMKKKKKFHSGDIAQQQADHHAEYLAKEVALEEAVESTLKKYIVEKAAYGPVTIDGRFLGFFCFFFFGEKKKKSTFH